MSPAEKQAREEQAERKMQKAADKAYSKSLTTDSGSEEAPQFEKLNRVVRQNTRNTQMPKTDEMGNPTGMKNGGTASSRADGCAVKGKTKGRMI